MAYDLNERLFVENGPAVRAARTLARRRSIWRALDPQHRLALVDGALGRAANDNAGGLPVAL